MYLLFKSSTSSNQRQSDISQQIPAAGFIGDCFETFHLNVNFLSFLVSLSFYVQDINQDFSPKFRFRKNFFMMLSIFSVQQEAESLTENLIRGWKFQGLKRRKFWRQARCWCCFVPLSIGVILLQWSSSSPCLTLAASLQTYRMCIDGQIHPDNLTTWMWKRRV